MAYKKLKYWFDETLAKMLAEKIGNVKSDFDAKAFTKAVASQVDELELKDRVEKIADELHKSLGNSFTKT